jgi:hypothetical protein
MENTKEDSEQLLNEQVGCVMRPSEIRKLSGLLQHVDLSLTDVQEFSAGLGWSDVPFPNLKTVEYHGHRLWSGHMKPDRVEQYHSGEKLIFVESPENAPSCMELLILVDELIGRSGDEHHRHFEGFRTGANRQSDCLSLSMGS